MKKTYFYEFQTFTNIFYLSISQTHWSVKFLPSTCPKAFISQHNYWRVYSFSSSFSSFSYSSAIIESLSFSLGVSLLGVRALLPVITWPTSDNVSLILRWQENLWSGDPMITKMLLKRDSPRTTRWRHRLLITTRSVIFITRSMLLVHRMLSSTTSASSSPNVVSSRWWRHRSRER